jgi:tetratricopeptide (TPR) repeat protein
MSGEALYERYKDALKRGHVASLRGRLEEALKAYAEAAAIAPERSTPHTSAATALMRRKRPADALRYYTAALALSPRDEAAMLGRAQALAALDRRPEAADAYDDLAELRASSGKLADAVDAARRALELAEGRERRRLLAQLIERLRASSPGEPGRVALERALRVLDGPAVAEAAVAATGVSAAARSAESGDTADEVAAATDAGSAITSDAEGPADEAEIVRLDGEAEPEAAEEAEFGHEDALEPAVAGGDAGELEAEAEPEAPEPEPIRAALDRDLPDDLDVEALMRRAEEAITAGAPAEALPLLLDLAAAYRRDGRIDAALDACYLALSLDPDDIALHLGLVELYEERGWTVLATEKLDLLDRLVALDDGAGADRVAAARAARG